MQDFFHIFIVQYLFNHESHSKVTVVFLFYSIYWLMTTNSNFPIFVV